MTVKLNVIQGRPAGKSLAFPSGDYFIGRGAECHIRPDSDMVSRQHCRLRVTDNEAFLTDLGSRNGTLVNGVLILRMQRLYHGDQVQFGPLIFEVQIDEVPVPLAIDPLFQSFPPREGKTDEFPAPR